MNMRIVSILLIALLGASACRVESVLWPTTGWKTSTAADQGVDQAELQKLDNEFARGDHGYVNGFLLIRHGYVVHEKSYEHDYKGLFSSAPNKTPGPYNYYDFNWHPFYQGGRLHTMQSISKSVTSALIGIAIQRGQIPGVETNALSYFDGYKILDDPRRHNWTLRHLLTMTTGIQWEEVALPYTDPANSCALMEASKDWTQFVLDQPMAADPGGAFVYNSGATQLLSHVLKKATGIHADAYAAEHLFKPLGISNFYWKRTPTGHADTEGGLYLEPRDLAKIGYLYLHGGAWEGKRILPEGWVETSTTVQTSTGSDARGLDYGYQWWVERKPGGPAYAALGYGGQRLVVIPELDLIAVFTGWNIYSTPPLDTRFAIERLRRMTKQS
jgi:CubicO group peptidase (beta-lactamase class C family)